MMRFGWRLLLLGALLGALPVAAHEVMGGFLEIKETQDRGGYDVLWKPPAIGEGASELAPIVPVFPEHCRNSGAGHAFRIGNAWTHRARIKCEGGLAGQTLAFEGLTGLATDVLVRVQHADGFVETHRVNPVAYAVQLRGAGHAPRAASAYLSLGVEHILLGPDHLLFVLALMLIVRERGMQLKTVTAFTAAHSVTLAAATVGAVYVPPEPLNTAIALSILFLALEVVRVWRGQTSLTIRHPWAVAFAFGLLHGFGFSSGLAELGLPSDERLLALFQFNVGVELGQLAFVLSAVLLERAWRMLRIASPLLVQRLPGYFVGTLGAYWTIQRLSVMLKPLW